MHGLPVAVAENHQRRLGVDIVFLTFAQIAAETLDFLFKQAFFHRRQQVGTQRLLPRHQTYAQFARFGIGAENGFVFMPNFGIIQ